jgi:hypothetical protein
MFDTNSGIRKTNYTNKIGKKISSVEIKIT